MPYPAAKLPYPIPDRGRVGSFVVRAIGLFFTDQKPKQMGNVYIFQWGKNSFWAVFTDSREKAFKMADLFIRSNHDTRIKYKLVRVLKDGEGILYTAPFGAPPL